MPVVLITVEADGLRAVATATMMYASTHPIRLVVSLLRASRTGRMVGAIGVFSASVLDEGQHDLARRAGASSPAPDAYLALGIDPIASPSDPSAPVACSTALAAFWCRVEARVDLPDHVIYVAGVEAALERSAGRPLVRHARRYMSLGSALTAGPVDRYPV
jgi:flavin reductase (DIM6/NTAB) family NADH-FMN oxidoreductase RutF